MKRPVIVFGLISGLIVSAFMATSMAIAGCASEGEGYGTMSMVIGYTSMLIAFSFIFVGVKSLRDKQLGGAITFGKAFGAGLLIAFIASTMYVITWAVEYNFFMSDFMTNYSQTIINQAKEAGQSAEEVQAITAEMNDMAAMYKNPFFFALFTYMEILPVGLLVALVSAGILRKKPQTPTMV